MGNSKSKESNKATIVKQPPNTLKVVLLGAGTNTLLRQLKIIFGNGFTIEERKEYTEIVHEIILNTLNDVSEDSKLDLPKFQNPLLRDEVKHFNY